MVLALVLVGIATGLASVVATAMAGMGIAAAALAYPLGGSVGLLCAAAIVILCNAAPFGSTFLAAGARD